MYSPSSSNTSTFTSHFSIPYADTLPVETPLRTLDIHLPNNPSRVVNAYWIVYAPALFI